MSLVEMFHRDFGAQDRRRGESYYRNGEVSEAIIVDGRFEADVAGSYGIYEVAIDPENQTGDGRLFCTCPRFDNGYNCKHIWAAILEFDELFQPVSSRSDVRGHGKVGGEEKARAKQVPAWQMVLRQVSAKSERLGSFLESGSALKHAGNKESQIVYTIDVSKAVTHDVSRLKLRILQRLHKKDGSWGKLKRFGFSHAGVASMNDSTDRQIATLLLGVDRDYSEPYSHRSGPTSFDEFEIDGNWSHALTQQLCGSGRLYWTLSDKLELEDFHPIKTIDFESPYSVAVVMDELPKPKGAAQMSVVIENEQERLDSTSVVQLMSNGIVLSRTGLFKISNPASAPIWHQLRGPDPVVVKKSERADFLTHLAAISNLPRVELPDSWQVETVEKLTPVGAVKLTNHNYRETILSGKILFRYGDAEYDLADKSTTLYDGSTNRWSERDPAAELALLSELTAFTLTDTTADHYVPHDFHLSKKHLVDFVDQLSERGWIISLHGKPIKQAGVFDISVESGQDWFDLSAEVSYEGETIALPALLRALSKKETFITLADGAQGRLPTELIEKYARLAQFGKVEDDKLRFRPSQAMLLDAMLDSKDIRVDQGFKKLRKKIQSFSGVKPKSAPRGFQGELRQYQEDGLGWLHFLRDFQFGGCLADDMGLGKTIQVLALLESRRIRKADQATPVKPQPQKGKTKKEKRAESVIAAAARSSRKPSIVVVPKSLIFNWIEEATKFTPKLRFLNYTGSDRQATVDESDGFDVLLTTYGTMRLDIAALSQIDFDYAILDESQAIKNSKALCAKASRLLQADHRLAMTGTPIENHLGELWSLFEFLNPAMLGAATGFARLTAAKKDKEEERKETLNALSNALRPFLLRRTKEQVLTDLPPKTEQTLYCDMLPAQKAQYTELKEYYRVKLAKKVETDGIGKSKIQVLEALLRLRQVACDPRLLKNEAAAGAKLELLQQQLGEIVSEGHKVLVFSQFTSLLSLVKQQLDKSGTSYEYLDGKTSNRAACVKRFQEDESVSAFLISLKAGGSGLNLTAADYVFLLDPWWNPAVEAQAIDRAHRIGQQNPVIAYRMICRDTVEEKIVSLQQSKRELADSVISSDESILRSLTADDLQTLFE